MWNSVKVKYSGIAICTIIAIAASTLAHKYNAPVMLFSLLLGLGLHFLYESKQHRAGIDFCSRSLLRFAVGLLGVRIAFADIVSLGITPPLIVIASMAITMVFAFMMARLLGLSKIFALLSGGSVIICGVSAAAAITTVLPKKSVDEKLFALTVIGITTFGLLAMVVFPLISAWVGLSDELAGVFIGGSIHDVAQVVGAGYSISPQAGDIATYIKLLRVALLLPVVMIIFFAFRENNSEMKASIGSFVPGFLLVFFALAVINNLGYIPLWLVEAINTISSGFLVIALVAIGVKTSLKQIVAVGWRPVVLMAAESIFFAGLVLAGILLFL